MTRAVDPDLWEAAASWIRRVASVEGRRARLSLWGEALRTSEPSSAARLVDEAVRRAAFLAPEAVAAYLPLADLPALAEASGPGRLSAVLLAARDADLDGCLLLLEHPGASRVPECLGPPPDPVLEALSLGHRKEAARGGRGPLLERLLKDPDPRVVGEVLRNPRLREFEVLAIASRRPCPTEVFWLLLRAEAWSRRPAVRRAMLHNPHCPPPLAVALVPLLHDTELKEIAHEEGLHPGVREGALLVLGWRRGGSA